VTNTAVFLDTASTPTPSRRTGRTVLPWWFWILPLLLVLFAVYRIATTPASERQVPADAIGNVVLGLLGAPTGTTLVVLRMVGAGGFLQFRILPATGSNRSVELGLPEVAWSRATFDAVGSALRAAGCELRIDQGSGCAEVRRYLRASTTGPSDELRTRLPGMASAALGALGWDGDAHLLVRFERS
jgi:hypothetical protein